MIQESFTNLLHFFISILKSSSFLSLATLSYLCNSVSSTVFHYQNIQSFVKHLPHSICKTVSLTTLKLHSERICTEQHPLYLRVATKYLCKHQLLLYSSLVDPEQSIRFRVGRLVLEMKRLALLIVRDITEYRIGIVSPC